MTKIKICGLRRLEDIIYANELKPDYVGFVFAESKRQVDVEQARVLAEALDKGIIKVGVFVNQPVQMVSELINDGIIQYAQLHGDEDNAYIESLRRMCAKAFAVDNTGIIKAVRVRNSEDIEQAENYRCDMLLLDAYSEQAAGGNGQKFDWTLIKDIDREFFLAGGITPDNVGCAIDEVRPYGIDASSSLETDGYKDRDKMQRLIDNVRKQK